MSPTIEGEKSSEVEDDDRIGEIVDSRYRIVAELGRGGMGRVYRAEHIAIKRPVAIKLLDPAYARISQFNERLQREAFATGRVDHPNCVGITDSGRLPDGTAYLVMELLTGRSLATELDRVGRLAPGRALRVVGHVLRGLAHAHRAGVVHRDLKPENVYLIDNHREPDFAKVLDFGIAKLVGDALEEAGGKQLTQTGLTIGSPRYLSPEQAAGDEIDERSDLYSLTVVLFEMLTGRRPFESEQGMQVIRMHLLTEPPSLADVAPELAWPGELEALIRRGLAKSRPLRFQTAAEYLAAVERLTATGAEVPHAPPLPPVSSTVPLRIERLPASGPAPSSAAVRDRGAAGTPANASRRGMFVAAGLGVIAVLASIALLTSGSGERGHTQAAASRGKVSGRPEPAPAPSEERESAAASDVDMIFEVDQEAAGSDGAKIASVEIPGQTEVESLLRRGARGAAKKRLLQLRKKHPRNAHIAYWLGSLYFDDSWWRDGFDAYRDAVRLDPATYRAKKEVIVDAMRCFISLSQSWRARDFLVNAIGEPSIPYLRSLAAKAKNRNVRRRAADTLRAIKR